MRLIREASILVFVMTNLQIAQAALLKYLLAFGYNGRHAVVKDTKKATKFSELNNVIYIHAREHGDAKGWGDEGVSQFAEEVSDEIEKECKVNIAEEDDKEFDRSFNP